MWLWVGVVVVLLLGAGVVLGLLGLSLWRRGKALADEIGRTSTAVGSTADRIHP